MMRYSKVVQFVFDNFILEKGDREEFHTAQKLKIFQAAFAVYLFMQTYTRNLQSLKTRQCCRGYYPITNGEESKMTSLGHHVVVIRTVL